MSFEIEGKIIVLEETIQVSEKFKKREFVIDCSEQKEDVIYDNFLKFQTVQDRCSQLDNCNIGDTVKLSFNLKGRKWEKDGKISYFTNLEAWRVEKLDMESPIMNKAQTTDNQEIIDDLPF